MIIEGFEISNWSCIRNLVVSDLPSTGVVVLHGPNQTGKSSIVKALRACLLDYPSTSTAGPVKGFFPRGGSEKPTVSVTFKTNGSTYRVTKTFGSNKSELTLKNSSGGWKVEADTATEVHRRTCELAGGDDSTKGLHQLLWLSQAQFELPESKKFDGGVQSRLRGLLGVLQTPLDDAFIQRVKTRWNVWYAGERKPGKTPGLKKTCKLAENSVRLDELQKELLETETKFRDAEVLIQRIGEIESLRIDLGGQLNRANAERKKCTDAVEQSKERISADRLAKANYMAAEKDHRDALELHADRKSAVERLAEAERRLKPASEKVEASARLVVSATAERDRLNKQRCELAEGRGKLQDRWSRINARWSALELTEKLQSATRDFERAASVERTIKDLEKKTAEQSAPDDKLLATLKDNRKTAEQLRSERNAASIQLNIVPELGAVAGSLSIDGRQQEQISAEATSYPIRRSANLLIPGWGRIEIQRGSRSESLDDVEKQISESDQQFADAIAPFGVSATNPEALDVLIVRAAERRQLEPEIARKKKELKELAPKGTATLQSAVVEWQTKLANVSIDEQSFEALPTDRRELEILRIGLDQQLQINDADLRSLNGEINNAETSLNESREKESQAKEHLAVSNAVVKSRTEELARLPSEVEIEGRLKMARQSLEVANDQLKRFKLTEEEEGAASRLTEAEISVAAIERQIKENEAKYNEIKGRLTAVEGLHAERSKLAARVDELERLVERETLERDAVDRLYEVFEDSRDRQLGTLIEPVHHRVLGWMRALGLGDYREVRFGDSFLPDKLVRRDDAEFAIHEESTGAQEQLGMLVRLALGSILSTAADPAVAILDDPLTHCDVGRLAKMRGVLRRASEGDMSSTPPAGPLQILILTCHPEWFRDEPAKVIDLLDSNVMQRFALA